MLKFLLVCVLFITACGQTLSPSVYKEAASLCESHGGLKVVFIENPSYTAYCANGRNFKSTLS